jgi:hypothetical protein
MVIRNRSTLKKLIPNFAIGWKGSYRIDTDAFIYIDKDSGRIVTFLGYPTRRLARLG